jgi:hypothetical protein
MGTERDPRATIGQMRQRWLWSLMLLPGGVAAGHVLGYGAAAVAGSAPSVGEHHAYLTWMFRLGVPFTVAVLGRAVVSGARSELPPVRGATLAAQLVGLFAAIEVLEHLHAGIGPSHSLTEASFVLGVAAQALVAVALAGLVRWMRRVGELAAGRRRPPVRRRGAQVRVLRSSDFVAGVVTSSLSRRGPPVPLAV